MEIIARAVGRRKEAVAQVQIVRGTGKFIINEKDAEQYLQFNTFSLLKIRSPFDALYSNNPVQKPAITNEITSTQNNTTSFFPLSQMGNKADGKSTVLTAGGDNNNRDKDLLTLAIRENNDVSTDTNLVINQRLDFDTIVKVNGGGLIGQVDAIKLAVARALCNIDQKTFVSIDASVNMDSRKIFKLNGFLTQDARVKERRKYGLKKARKAPQYSKR